MRERKTERETETEGGRKRERLRQRQRMEERMGKRKDKRIREGQTERMNPCFILGTNIALKVAVIHTYTYTHTSVIDGGLKSIGITESQRLHICSCSMEGRGDECTLRGQWNDATNQWQ